MINEVKLIGRLGAVPEIRTVGDNRKVATLRVATWITWKNKSTNEFESKTEWHRVIAWGEQAERIAKMQAGDLVYVEGRIETRKFTDSNNVERYSTEIVGTVRAMPSAKGKASGSGDSRGVPNTTQPPNEDSNFDMDEDDLPF